MTQQAAGPKQLEAAATSLLAKLRGLSPDERLVLAAALRQADEASGEATDDVDGYLDHWERVAAAQTSVNALPIWGPLQQAIAELTRPIVWPK